MHNFGYTPDSGRHPRRLFKGLGLTGNPKGSADLRPFAPSVQQQYKEGSCVGHGDSCAMTTAHCAAGKPLFGLDAKGKPIPCSPRDIYAGARCDDRKAAGQPNTTPLQDQGTEVLSAVQYMAEFGVRKTCAPMTDTDDNGQIVTVNSDCVSSNVNDEPTLNDIEQDSANPVLQAYQITSTGKQRIIDVCLALDAGHPVVFGTYVDSTFLAYTGGIIGAQNTKDPDGGGHCMCFLAYSTNPDGSRVFVLRNSWGDGSDGLGSWGEQGDGRVNEAFVEQIEELFATVAS